MATMVPARSSTGCTPARSREDAPRPGGDKRTVKRPAARYSRMASTSVSRPQSRFSSAGSRGCRVRGLGLAEDKALGRPGGHKPEIAREELVDVLVFAGLNVGIHGFELLFAADDEVYAGGIGLAVAGKNFGVHGVHAAEELGWEGGVLAEREQVLAEFPDDRGREAVGEIGGDGGGAVFVTIRRVGGLEGEGDRIFGEVRIARAVFDDVDSEVERLRDFRHALGVVAGPAIMQGAANAVAVGKTGADRLREDSLFAIAGEEARGEVVELGVAAGVRVRGEGDDGRHDAAGEIGVVEADVAGRVL